MFAERRQCLLLFMRQKEDAPEPSEDASYMRECLTLGRKGTGFVSPNPLVGAVLVHDGRVVARGYHRIFGGPHAEVECLRRFKHDASSSTLYVNLEPCSHYGKTPPCVDLIVQRGIRRVIVGMQDPNPLVSGRSIRKLRRAGIEVRVGVLRKEAEELNRTFIKHITTGLPYVHVKIAQTADGFIASRKRMRGYITSSHALKQVHRWRAEYDAVLVGARTLTIDNPQLNVRFTHGRDPAVVVVDGRLFVSGKERVFRSARARRIFVCTTNDALQQHKAKAALLVSLGVSVLPFQGEQNRIDPRALLKKLYRLGIASVLVEGGREIFSQFIERRLLDELTIFFSPKRFGRGLPAMSDRAQQSLMRWLKGKQCFGQTVGNDYMLTARKQ